MAGRNQGETQSQDGGGGPKSVSVAPFVTLCAPSMRDDRRLATGPEEQRGRKPADAAAVTHYISQEELAQEAN